MVSIEMTMGQAHDLAIILDQMPPSTFTSFKEQRTHGTIVDKCLTASHQIIDLLERAEKELTPIRDEFNSLTLPEDQGRRQKLKYEMTKIALPFVEEVNPIRNEKISILFSQQAVDYLHGIFFENIAKHLRSTRSVVEMAKALGIKEENEEN